MANAASLHFIEFTMIVFLALDTLERERVFGPATGAEHQGPAADRRETDGARFAYAPIFTQMMEPYLAHTEFVVTDWGVRWPEVIQRPDLPVELSGRIVDVVWLLDIEDYRSDRVDLHGSIRFWLKRRRPSYAGPWLCIDRHFHSWPERERDRLIVGGGLGHPALQASFQREIDSAYALAAGPDPQGTA